MRPSTARYSHTAIALHWLLAIAIVATFLVGWNMVDMKMSLLRLKLYNWHKWAGVCILALSAGRLLWRLFHEPPPDMPMPTWQRAAAHWTHRLLYVLFFAVPLAGWAYSATAGYPVVLFGVLPLPFPLDVDRELSEAIKPWHGYLAYSLAALVGLHVAGALKHQFIDRHRLIQRMWPSFIKARPVIPAPRTSRTRSTPSKARP